MVSEFEASNGYTLHAGPGGIIINNRAAIDRHALGKYSIEALREYFQHERDQELGRWRWPEDHDYVVYPGYSPGEQERFVRAVDEKTGVSTLVYEGQADGVRGHVIAEAYFDAHPERKPWEDAEEGEVWVLDLKNGQTHPAIFQADAFRDTGGAWSLNEIKSARRIWPESD